MHHISMKPVFKNFFHSFFILILSSNIFINILIN
nr:MAG TPA: hypothetical protein [Caudoviricetes sp.]